VEITVRSLWTLIHGMGFGALYLLACSGALIGWSASPPQRFRLSLHEASNAS
jgi:hypothetical protein